MGFKHDTWEEYEIIRHPIDDVVYAVYDTLVDAPYSRNIIDKNMTLAEALRAITEDEQINSIARKAWKSGYEIGLNRGKKEGFSEGTKVARNSIAEPLKRVKEVTPAAKLDDPYFLDKIVRGDFGNYKGDVDGNLKEDD